MARQCHRQESATRLTCSVSSSGGGLPGRPGLEKVSGRSLFLGMIFSPHAASSFLPPVAPHPLRLAQDVSFHRRFQILLARARFQIELRVQRVQPEVVAMRVARRWAWAVVSGLAEVVHALLRAVGELRLLWCAFN